jgi:hypothetical protein
MALWPGATAQTDGAVRQSIPWLPPMWKYEEGGRLGALMVVDATGADEQQDGDSHAADRRYHLVGTRRARGAFK